MDKNIAALMRNDTRTVLVNFNMGVDDEDVTDQVLKTYDQQFKRPTRAVSRGYTYVTDLPLAAGDLVVVNASGTMKLATVIEVHDDVTIEPNSNISYKWVVARVDLSYYEALVAKNKTITDAVAEAYKANLRRSFAQQILSGMPEDQRLALEKLTNG
jgi:hypothetical protein